MSIGAYLRGIRSRRDPAAPGLAHTGTRRVPGLRREEAAVLAGISADYYTRIEQDRERHPSVQIVEALARGLDLTADERAHLFRLAGYAPPVPAPQETVRPELARLIGRWHDLAAFVLTGTMDVLAPNALFRALFTDQDIPVDGATLIDATASFAGTPRPATPYRSRRQLRLHRIVGPSTPEAASVGAWSLIPRRPSPAPGSPPAPCSSTTSAG
jgi:transcriptional regulator with XRE-family HTH domain